MDAMVTETIPVPNMGLLKQLHKPVQFPPLEVLLRIPQEVVVCHGDLTDDAVTLIEQKGVVACDIETTGLDWRNDRIATCQLYVPGSEEVYLVRFDGNVKAPTNLRFVLEASAIQKIFHHALFDLKFLRYQVSAIAKNVCCTKIAAKILYNDPKKSTSLKVLLEEHLKIHIDKSQQKSNWMQDALSLQQLVYVMSDVAYLPSLLCDIKKQLTSKGRMALAEECFAHIPARVEMEVSGYSDVFTY